MASVTVDSVSKSYGGQPVLRGVDLAVREGEIAALLGPSGCGKTTLLRLIAGFERVDAGEIAIGGETASRAASHTPPEKRRIGYVPQEGALFPHLTVAGNVAYGLPRAERGSGRVAETLALVGCEALADRYPHQLSGGQQQRVALARALAPRPRLIVLDEPFNGLDLELRRSVCAEVVATLRRTGATAIIVTHDPEEAFASADSLAVMHAGRIVQQGAPRTVYRAPGTLEAARITGPAILLDGTIHEGRAETPIGAAELIEASRGVSGAADICVRPEQIALVAHGLGAHAPILERSFRGDHSLLTVTVGEHRIAVRAPADFDAAADHVHLAVEGACAAFLRRGR
ncbi:ABC transporter ATP-binding protein [Chelatococcus sambhunathii]|uniref:ABC transporter ATP-binding protein n=1 Tax=Chelatococcus sambhunathii TaxID=363953 RepID=A0ABU1DFD7_9HYPH|nr:ABC transporter ATP-binding protein [Chelatococcus sambhunathii]MDR4306826.1 ABC transporter ATP-binding protein [Chelatococcus sambhunathii]